MYYGGIDRVYGEISKESADIILDLIEEYEEMREATKEETENVSKYVESISEPTGVEFLDLIEEYEEIKETTYETE